MASRPWPRRGHASFCGQRGVETSAIPGHLQEGGPSQYKGPLWTCGHPEARIRAGLPRSRQPRASLAEIFRAKQKCGQYQGRSRSPRLSMDEKKVQPPGVRRQTPTLDRQVRRGVLHGQASGDPTPLSPEPWLQGEEPQPALPLWACLSQLSCWTGNHQGQNGSFSQVQEGTGKHLLK